SDDDGAGVTDVEARADLRARMDLDSPEDAHGALHQVIGGLQRVARRLGQRIFLDQPRAKAEHADGLELRYRGQALQLLEQRGGTVIALDAETARQIPPEPIEHPFEQ